MAQIGIVGIPRIPMISAQHIFFVKDWSLAFCTFHISLTVKSYISDNINCIASES